MILKSHELAGYLRQPDPRHAGVLFYGDDAMRVADARQQITLSHAGPDADKDMRLTRLAASDLRKDPAALIDELKARGFFDGPRVVIVEDANDQAAPTVSAALDAWEEGDAFLIVTAGALRKTSKLRKAFESARGAMAAGIYDRPMGRDEITRALQDQGLGNLDTDADRAVHALAAQVEPGDFRQTLEKLALYKLRDPSPVSAADVQACAPRSTEADLDALINLVAEGRVPEIAPVLHRVYAQGTQPVGLSIALLRHFRQLHRVSSDPGGPGAGVGKLRPPVFGPQRDRLARQASDWGRDRLDQALRGLVELDMELRSGAPVPMQALVERWMIRLAHLRGS